MKTIHKNLKEKDCMTYTDLSDKAKGLARRIVISQDIHWLSEAIKEYKTWNINKRINNNNIKEFAYRKEHIKKTSNIRYIENYIKLNILNFTKEGYYIIERSKKQVNRFRIIKN
jgi:pantothenate kinase